MAQGSRRKDAGQQPDGRIDHGQCRDLAAGQHEVAQAIFLSGIECGQPFVNALVMPANDDEPLQLRKTLRVGLPERLASRGGDDDRAALLRRSGRQNSVEYARDRLDPQHHSRTPPNGESSARSLPRSSSSRWWYATVTTPALTARPTIDRPTNGAKTSGKSVTTSRLNITVQVFRFWRRFAFRRAASPRRRALEALDRRDFARAERELSALLESALSEAGAKVPAREKAFLLNKRGVARVGLERLESAADDFTAALETVANYPPALANLGNLDFERGQVDAAIARYEAAIRADPEYAVAYDANTAVPKHGLHGKTKG